MSKRRRVPYDERRRSRRSYANPPAFEALWGPYHTCLTPEEDEERRVRERQLRLFGFEMREGKHKLVIDMCGYERIEDSERYQVIDGPPVVPPWAGQVIENVYGEPDEGK